MNAVIVYDDIDVALEARIALERAAQRADGALSWTTEFWLAGLLGLPLGMDAALNDAVPAHLIVLALRPSRPLPDGMLDWLERWATRQQVQDAALALFDGGKGGTLAATSAPELSHFAQRHGLSFICGGVGPAGNGGAVSGRSLPETNNRLEGRRLRATNGG